MADATIILAGGVGSRLWPASLKGSPKQLLRIGGGRSLVQRALVLASGASPQGPLVVVTGETQVAAIRDHAAELQTEIPGINGRLVYLPEPVGRNTAPAITLGLAYLKSILTPESTVLVLTADHVIGPTETFASDATLAGRMAAEGALVCFGITPGRPETGYGYIQSGERHDPGYRVRAFREKPDLQTAAKYLADGGYFWNAGMFCFTIGTYFEELAAHAPDIAEAFEPLSFELTRGSDGSRSGDAADLMPVYSRISGISIDYALMERSSNVSVLPATFDWNDVGSWDEVARISGETLQTGSPEEPVIQIESTGNHVESDLPVAICGVSDLHVVVRNGKVLVCKRGASQLVKRVVEIAEADGQTHLI